MTVPLSVPDDELDDFAAVGVDLNMSRSEAEIDAAASECLRRMAWYEAQVAQTDEAERLEMERIRARYERRRTPLVARREHYEAQVLVLAQRADFGKKKSRSVGNGTYGKRTKPESVKIVDQAAAVEFARDARPDAIRTKVTETIDVKAISGVVLDCIHSTGKVPDGFEHHAETETYFAKVEV